MANDWVDDSIDVSRETPELHKLLAHASVNIVVRWDVFSRISKLEQAVKLLNTDNYYLFERLRELNDHVTRIATQLESLYETEDDLGSGEAVPD